MPKQLLSCSEGFGAISKITTIPTFFASEKMIDIFVNFWFFKIFLTNSNRISKGILSTVIFSRKKTKKW